MRLPIQIFFIFVLFLFNCVFAESNYKVQIAKVIDINKPIPGLEKARFETVGIPSLAGDHILFRGVGPNGHVGLYLFNHGKFTTIADTQTPIPKGQGKFKNFSHAEIVLTKDNDFKITFLGRGEFGQQGIYQYQNGKLQIIANQATKLPDHQGDFVVFRSVDVSPLGLGLKVKELGEHDILYTYYDGRFAKTVSTATKIPHGKGTFIAYVQPTVTKQGVVFLGYGKRHQTGLYRRDKQGHLHVIVNTQNKIPNGKGRFIRFGRFAVLPEGILAFVGEGKNHQYGLYETQIIPEEEDPISAIVGGHTLIPPQEKHEFDRVDKLSQDKGNVAFLGYGRKKMMGIFAIYNRELIKVMTNQGFLGFRSVKKIELGPNGFSQNQIAFRVTLGGNKTAIYVAVIHPRG